MQYGWCPYPRGSLDTQAERTPGVVEVMLPQPRNHQKLREGPPLSPSEGHLNLGLPVSRTRRE